MTPTLEDFDYPTGPAATFSSHARTAFRPFEPVTPEKQRLINQVVTCATILADVPGEYWATRLAEAQAELDQYIDAEQAISAALSIVECEGDPLYQSAETTAADTSPRCACFEHIGDNPNCPVHADDYEPSAEQVMDALQEDYRRIMHNLIYLPHQVHGKRHDVYGGDPERGMIFD